MDIRHGPLRALREPRSILNDLVRYHALVATCEALREEAHQLRIAALVTRHRTRQLRRA